MPEHWLHRSMYAHRICHSFCSVPCSPLPPLLTGLVHVCQCFALQALMAFSLPAAAASAHVAALNRLTASSSDEDEAAGDGFAVLIAATSALSRPLPACLGTADMHQNICAIPASCQGQLQTRSATECFLAHCSTRQRQRWSWLWRQGRCRHTHAVDCQGAGGCA